MASGGQDSSNANERIMEKYLTCPLCLESYTKPKVLPCTHTACLGCLDKYVGGFVDNGRFPCMCCTESIDIPPGGVSAFKNSHLITRLQDDFQTPRNCGICALGNSEVPAVSKCLECSDTLCHNCSDIHLKTRATLIHTVIKLEDLAPEVSERVAAANVQCQNHTGEVVRYFCVQCDRLICRDCKTLDHQDHKSVAIEQAAVGKKQELEYACDILLAKEKQFGKLCKELQSGLERSKNQEESTVKQIQYETENIMNKLRTHSGRKIQELKTFYQTQQNTALSSIEENNVLLTQFESSREHIRLILQKSSDPEILDSCKELKERASRLAGKECLVNPLHILSLTKEGTEIIDAVFSELYTCNKQLVNQTETKMVSRLPLPVTDNWVTGLDHSGDEMLVCVDGKVFQREQSKWIDISPPGEYRVADVCRSSNSLVITMRDKNGDVYIGVGDDTSGGQYTIINTGIRCGLFAVCGVTCAGERSGLRYLVTDCNKGCVLKLDEGGKLMCKFGQDVLRYPINIAVGARGEIIVSDWEVDDIAVFHSDGKFKVWLRQHNKEVVTDEILAKPYGVCTHEDGTIFVASPGTSTVLMFTADGDFLQTVLSSTNGIDLPRAIHLSKDNVLTVGVKNGIHFFARETVWAS